MRLRFAVWPWAWPWAAALFGQEFSDIQLEKFAWGFNYTEGPVWTPRDSGGTLGEALDAKGRPVPTPTAVHPPS